MAFCGNCGKELDDGVKFCPDCGAPVAGDIKRRAPAAKRVIVEKRVVQATTYHDISFAGGVYRSRASRIFLYFATLICLYFTAIYVYFASGTYFGDKNSMSFTVLFGAILLPITAYALLYALPKIKITFCKTDRKTTLLKLYKMQKFQITQIPVILFAFIVLIVCFFVPIGKISAIFGNSNYAFYEPELVDLYYGYYMSKMIIVGIVFLIFFCVYIFALIYATVKAKLIWRYFKGKMVRGAGQPKGWKDKKLLEKNFWLKAELGGFYDFTVNPYVSVRYRDKNAGYGINSEPNYIKYIIFGLFKYVILAAVILTLIIVYCVKVPPHLRRTIRPGTVAQIEIGYTHEQVKDVLGEPSVNSTQYEYIYMGDGGPDIDDIQSPDDLDDAFGSDFSTAAIIVYFNKEKDEEQFKVERVEYNTNYLSGMPLDDKNIKDTLTIEKEIGSSYGFAVKKITVITLYENGSIKIEGGKN